VTKLTPPLKYPGGKHYLAAKIIALMPKHTHYVEPYFGGGAVLLAKDPEGISEVVNDLDERLTRFWRALQHTERFNTFKRIVDAIPFSEIEWKDAGKKNMHYESPLMNTAVQFFLKCRQSRSGMSKDFATLSRTRTRSGMNEQASAWLNAVEGLPEVHARLKRVVILNRPALDVIKQQDGTKTLFYLDPPYLPSTRTPGLYTHEMTENDHMDLLVRLDRIKGKFLLSGYRNKIYDNAAKMYGWNRRDFKIDNKLAGGATKKTMTECVWTNF